MNGEVGLKCARVSFLVGSVSGALSSQSPTGYQALLSVFHT